MQDFAVMLDRLYFTHSNLAKAEILRDYIAKTPDPDRGFALAAIAGTLEFQFFKRGVIQDLMVSRVDPVLFEYSRDYVGETSETVAHLWQAGADAIRLNRLPTLPELIENFSAMNKEEVKLYLSTLLDNTTPSERWAILKLGTGNLRVGVSARFVKNVLADYGGVDVHEIEEIWHSQSPPYEALFAWLEKRGDKPEIGESLNYVPVMLSHPLEDKEFEAFPFEEFAAEWKFDGIRVQLISNGVEVAIYSRTGDEISGAFPDLAKKLTFNAILDGELLVKTDKGIGSFNDLQQRLNRKKPDKKTMVQYPGYVVVYDALFLDGVDIRKESYIERRRLLREWWAKEGIDYMEISEPLELKVKQDMHDLRVKANRVDIPHIEGLMLKRKESPYIAGRPKGEWYKWKRDPLVIDAVLMYAQRGSGKRSSFYSDYTFGLWTPSGELLPVGKAYSGFTDEELKKVDKWIRANTTQSFGPVREVKKEMVFELAFDAVQRSSRHKSGYALRFPRVNRIRWDKPAAEADVMGSLEKMVVG